jgi:transcriptional regulator with XRE-family HTH domain
MRFPQRLRELREQKRISRRVLAELCGLSKNMVSRYERGERIPNLDEAAKLADFFGVTIDYLYGR